MTVSTWIALAGLASAMFIQAIVFAFVLGKLFQEVATLKAQGPDRAVQGLAIARLEVQVSHISGQLTDLSKGLSFLRTPPVYQPEPEAPARRRRSAPPAE